MEYFKGSEGMLMFVQWRKELAENIEDTRKNVNLRIWNTWRDRRGQDQEDMKRHLTKFNTIHYFNILNEIEINR